MTAPTPPAGGTARGSGGDVRTARNTAGLSSATTGSLCLAPAATSPQLSAIFRVEQMPTSSICGPGVPQPPRRRAPSIGAAFADSLDHRHRSTTTPAASVHATPVRAMAGRSVLGIPGARAEARGDRATTGRRSRSHWRDRRSDRGSRAIPTDARRRERSLVEGCGAGSARPQHAGAPARRGRASARARRGGWLALANGSPGDDRPAGEQLGICGEHHRGHGAPGGQAGNEGPPRIEARTLACIAAIICAIDAASPLPRRASAGSYQLKHRLPLLLRFCSGKQDRETVAVGELRPRSAAVIYRRILRAAVEDDHQRRSRRKPGGNMDAGAQCAGIGPEAAQFGQPPAMVGSGGRVRLHLGGAQRLEARNGLGEATHGESFSMPHCSNVMLHCNNRWLRWRFQTSPVS